MSPIAKNYKALKAIKEDMEILIRRANSLDEAPMWELIGKMLHQSVCYEANCLLNYFGHQSVAWGGGGAAYKTKVNNWWNAFKEKYNPIDELFGVEFDIRGE